MKLRDPSIKKYPEIISSILYFIQIYLCLMESCKELLMREHTKEPYKICTILVESHNYSSTLMYQCWVKVVVFQKSSVHDKIKKKYQMLPRPYVESCSGEKGH